VRGNKRIERKVFPRPTRASASPSISTFFSRPTRAAQAVTSLTSGVTRQGALTQSKDHRLRIAHYSIVAHATNSYAPELRFKVFNVGRDGEGEGEGEAHVDI